MREPPDIEDPLPPELLRIVEALARANARRDYQESLEAEEETAALQSALGLQEDYPAFKTRGEALMQAFYEQVGFWSGFQLKARVRFVRIAVEAIGPSASNDAIIRHAALLAARELAARPVSKTQDGRRPRR